MSDMTVSVESELDRRIETLIGKMVDGSASPRDREEYAELAKRRARLMYPPSFKGDLRPVTQARGMSFRRLRVAG